MLCDSLPDPENERDLTTFITIWKEQKEQNMKDAVQGCQVSEDVIRSMQDIYGEALAEY